MSDRQTVHVGPADESKGQKRTESKARGFQSRLARTANDLSEATEEVREEVEAADQAALDAALAAAAAQGTAEDALFEAQFGSIAVGRLSAGTINAGTISISAGSTTINSAGITIAQGTGASNTLQFAGGNIRSQLSDSIEIRGTPWVFLTSGPGGQVEVDGSRVRTYANSSVPIFGSAPNSWNSVASTGSRTTGGPSNARTGGQGTTSGTAPSGWNHDHNMSHTHTVTI